jgi:N-acetylglucosamine malate deacetylase 1
MNSIKRKKINLLQQTTRGMDNILVICAHPDDETLGLGGTIAIHTKKGEKVNLLVFTDGELARGGESKSILNRQKELEKACSILGVKNVICLNYEDQKLDTVPLVTLAKEIEKIIKKIKPKIVYTHFHGDLNQDHRALFHATLIASRPTPSSIIKKIICFEVPSSTEWGNFDSSFNPNYFVNIESSLKKKMLAVKQYKNEIPIHPHPRSIKNIKNLAQIRGANVGLKYAEAFIIIREIYDPQKKSR